MNEAELRKALKSFTDYLENEYHRLNDEKFQANVFDKDQDGNRAWDMFDARIDMLLDIIAKFRELLEKAQDESFLTLLGEAGVKDEFEQMKIMINRKSDES